VAERDLQKDLDAVKEDLAKLRLDIAELTQNLLDTGRSEVNTARTRVRTEARNLGRELRETLNETGERGLRTVDSVEQLLTDKPLVSLLASFGLGLLVGDTSAAEVGLERPGRADHRPLGTHRG
jgi:ElaB/YqjD/DUF883 family membrane-anchored ribosome-binding protein